LQVLALYSNEILLLQNIHHLKNLNVLRVGMNKLKSRDDIVYLRKLPNLRSTVR
jgi:Leucine-rich repeat (LRR) protein